MEKRVTSRFVLAGDNQLSNAFGKAENQVNSLLKKVAAFATVAKTISIVKQQAENIDVLAKTSDAIGIATESLQALQIMAQLTGTTAEQLSTRIVRMQKNIGEAARRGGAAADALEDVGLSLKDIIDLPADQQLEAVAKALARVRNDTLRASLANDLFGRDAVRMLKLTDQLAKEGLGGMRKELEQLGFLITRSEAAGVERMNDSMLKASLVGEGLEQTFTAALAPSIAAIAEQFTDAAKESGGFKDDTVAAADATGSAMAFVADVVDSVGRTFQVTSKLGIVSFELLKVGALDLADKIVNGPNRAFNQLLEYAKFLPMMGSMANQKPLQFPDITDGFKNDMEVSRSIVEQAMADIDQILLKPLPSAGFKERLAAIKKELADFQQAVRGGDGAGQGMDTALEKQYQTMVKASEAQFKILGKYVDELDASDKKFADSLRGVLDELYPVEGAGRQLADTLKILSDAAAEQGWSQEKLAEAVGLATKGFDEQVMQIRKSKDELDQYAVQAARDIQSAFADYLFDPFDKGLKGMLRGFVDVIRRMLAEAAAAQLAKSLFGDFGSSGKIGGLVGTAISAIGAFGGGGSGSGDGFYGPPMAAGGSFSGMKPFLVGEHGPEVIMPGGAGTVIPNHKIGGTNVTVNIDARESDNPGRLLALVPLIQSQIEQSMIRKSRRGYLG